MDLEMTKLQNESNVDILKKSERRLNYIKQYN